MKTYLALFFFSFLLLEISLRYNLGVKQPIYKARVSRLNVTRPFKYRSCVIISEKSTSWPTKPQCLSQWKSQTSYSYCHVKHHLWLINTIQYNHTVGHSCPKKDYSCSSQYLWKKCTKKEKMSTIVKHFLLRNVYPHMPDI